MTQGQRKQLHSLRVKLANLDIERAKLKAIIEEVEAIKVKETPQAQFKFNAAYGRRWASEHNECWFTWGGTREQAWQNAYNHIQKLGRTLVQP